MTRLQGLHAALRNVFALQFKNDQTFSPQDPTNNPWLILQQVFDAIAPQIDANEIKNEEAIRTMLLNSVPVQMHMAEKLAFRQLIYRFLFSLHLRVIVPGETLPAEQEEALLRTLGFEFFSHPVPAATLFWARAMLAPIFNSAPAYAAKFLRYFIATPDMQAFFSQHAEFRAWLQGEASNQSTKDLPSALPPLAPHEIKLEISQAWSMARDLRSMSPLLAMHLPEVVSAAEMPQQAKMVANIIDQILQTATQYPPCTLQQLMGMPSVQTMLGQDRLLIRVVGSRLIDKLEARKTASTEHITTFSAPTLTKPGSLIPEAVMKPAKAYRAGHHEHPKPAPFHESHAANNSPSKVLAAATEKLSMGETGKSKHVRSHKQHAAKLSLGFGAGSPKKGHGKVSIIPSLESVREHEKENTGVASPSGSLRV